MCVLLFAVEINSPHASHVVQINTASNCAVNQHEVLISYLFCHFTATNQEEASWLGQKSCTSSIGRQESRTKEDRQPIVRKATKELRHW